MNQTERMALLTAIDRLEQFVEAGAKSFSDYDPAPDRDRIAEARAIIERIEG